MRTLCVYAHHHFSSSFVIFMLLLFCPQSTPPHTPSSPAHTYDDSGNATLYLGNLSHAFPSKCPVLLDLFESNNVAVMAKITRRHRCLICSIFLATIVPKTLLLLRTRLSKKQPDKLLNTSNPMEYVSVNALIRSNATRTKRASSHLMTKTRRIQASTMLEF